MSGVPICGGPIRMLGYHGIGHRTSQHHPNYGILKEVPAYSRYAAWFSQAHSVQCQIRTYHVGVVNVEDLTPRPFTLQILSLLGIELVTS